MNEKWRSKAHKLIKRSINNLVKSMGGSCEIEIKVGYPFLVNDYELSLSAKNAMIEYMGEKNVVDLPIRMTAEDFSYYSQHAKSCFYRLGTGNVSKGITSPVHTSSFNIDENALRIGAGLMSFLAYRDIND